MRDVDIKLMRRASAVARQALPSCDWSAIADRIVDDRRAWEAPLRKPAPAIDRSLMAGLPELRQDGVHVFPRRLDGARVAAIRAYLESLPVYRGSHVYSSDARLSPLSEVQRDSTFAGYTADQVMRAPHLMDALNDPAIVDFVEGALGCVPTLYSVNAWWSLPGTVPTGHGMQQFHRDNDDWRFFTLFLYLTDVDAGAGPHQLVAGSHTRAGMTALLERAQARSGSPPPFSAAESFTGTTYFAPGFTQFAEKQLREDTLDITGPAGTMFIANTLAIHRGLMPSQTPRLIVWARYGLGPNTNSVDLEQGPLARFQVPAALADTPRNRYVNRLLFEFERSNSLVCDPSDGATAAAPAMPAPAAAVEAAAPPPFPPGAQFTQSPALRSIASARRTGARRALVWSVLHWLRGLLRRSR